MISTDTDVVAVVVERVASVAWIARGVRVCVTMPAATSTTNNWALQPAAALLPHYPFLYKGDAEKLQVLFCNYLSLGQFELGRLVLLRLAELRPLAALTLLDRYAACARVWYLRRSPRRISC